MKNSIIIGQRNIQ